MGDFVAAFELNFNNIKTNIDIVKKDVKKYKQTISILKNELENIDSHWKDKNTIPFINKVNNDYNKFSDHIVAIDNYINLINNFCVSIKNTISYETGINILISLKYNSDLLKSASIYLDNAYSYINKNIMILNTLIIPDDFEYKSLLKSYKVDFVSYKNRINNIKKKINNINPKILNVIENVKDVINKKNIVEIDNQIMNYKWRIYAESLVKSDLDIRSKEMFINSLNKNEEIKDSSNLNDVNKDGLNIEIIDIN